MRKLFTALVTTLGLLFGNAMAAEPPAQYTELASPVATKDPSKIEVVELFGTAAATATNSSLTSINGRKHCRTMSTWYACLHCLAACGMYTASFFSPSKR